MYTEVRTVLRAVMMDFFFNCWCLEIPLDNHIWHVPGCVYNRAKQVTCSFTAVDMHGMFFSDFLSTNKVEEVSHSRGTTHLMTVKIYSAISSIFLGFGGFLVLLINVGRPRNALLLC
jgi:hypothetical protein